MTVSAIAPVASQEAPSAQLGLSSSTTSSNSQAATNIAVSSTAASAILATVSIPSGTGSHSSPPLSTDTIQLLTDLSSGNFTAAKSDVAKVQEDLQTRQPPATSTSSDSSLTRQLNSLKESLEAGKTGDALNILTGILSQSSNVSGSIVNTSA